MENHEPRLYSYKMTHVTGKAPCVYEKELILPACKPKLRIHIRPGDWMAVWTSKSLKSCPTEVGEEQLVYLALVDRKISVEEFHREYDTRKTSVSIQGEEACCDGGCPPEEECDDDAPVLMCKEFYYFSDKQSLKVPEELRPRVPAGQDFKGWETAGGQAVLFIEFVRRHEAECIQFNHQ